MSKSEYKLTLCGLAANEREAIGRVCKLTRHRSHTYTLQDDQDFTAANIVLVDADDPSAVEFWRNHVASQPELQTLWVSQDPQNIRLNEYTYVVNRGSLSGRLIRSLDQIVYDQFSSNKTFLIDDNSELLLASHKQHRQANHHGQVSALVIDDSNTVRAQMKYLLESSGLAVTVADDAESGLALAQKMDFSIIFLDIELPEMDGYTACKKLKLDHKTRHCPVVMLTGRDSPFDRIRGVMAGCKRYLVKPASSERLFSVLNELVPGLTARSETIATHPAT